MKRFLRVLWVGAVISLVIVAATAVWAYTYYERNAVSTELTIEAGTVPDANLFVRAGRSINAFFTRNSGIADIHLPGTYAVTVRRGLWEYDCRVNVVDTTPPTAVPAQVTLMAGEICEASEFVGDIDDATAVTVQYITAPDYNKTGTQFVDVLLMDVAGNTTRIRSKLNITGTAPTVTIEAGDPLPEASQFLVDPMYEASYAKRPDADITRQVGTHTMEIAVGNATTSSELRVVDTTPPEILGVGQDDRIVYVGDSVDWWQNVEVTDNSIGEITTELDFENAPVDEYGNYLYVGEYELTRIATDAYGNTARVPVKVTVKGQSEELNEVWARCDAILEAIITPEMTPVEQITAVWHYVNGSVLWRGKSERDNWMHAAMEGFDNICGDCYVYTSCCHALFQRLGYPSEIIQRIPKGEDSHWWNLVDIGDGWRHVDCTIYGDRSKIILWTTDQIQAYNVKIGWRHKYDPELYPELVTHSATTVINQ